MPVFQYKGIDGNGREVSGIKDADTAKSLRATLRKDGIFLTEFKEAKAGKAAAAEEKGKGLQREVQILGSGIARRQVAIFTQQLAVLLRSGIALSEGLNILSDQQAGGSKRSPAARMQRVIADLRRQVNEGTSFADALANHPKVFEELYIHMVRSGETAGNMEEVLERLSEFIERDLDLKSKVMGTLLYPLIMVIVSFFVLVILMMVVVPKITQIFADMEKALPWNTALLIKISQIGGKYWWAFLIGAPIAALLFTVWKQSPGGRTLWDRFKLNVPLFGMIIRYLAVSRFTRTLGTMFQAGVPLLRALDISKFVLGNVVLQRVIDGAQEGIREGDSIANQLKKSPYFEPMVIHMVAVGERSGQLSMMLANVAQAYEKQVEIRLSRLTTLLEPIMIVVMGGTVAFVIFSIIIPILQMNEVVQ